MACPCKSDEFTALKNKLLAEKQEHAKKKEEKAAEKKVDQAAADVKPPCAVGRERTDEDRKRVE